MKITLNVSKNIYTSKEVIVIAAFAKKRSESETESKYELMCSHWPSVVRKQFEKASVLQSFQGIRDSHFPFLLEDGGTAMALGLGEKKSIDREALRQSFANLYKSISTEYRRVSVIIDDFFIGKDVGSALCAIVEGLLLASYQFEEYKKSKEVKLREVVFAFKNRPPKAIQRALEQTKILCESVNICRDFVNEPPNVLHSSEYSGRILQDTKKYLKRVKSKVLGKSELRAEKMGMFLAVNAGSGHPPQLVHLMYTPKKSTKKTPHVALVGKGLTFDTGGYSLKSGSALLNMKTDMAGSATVYGAFRAAVLTEVPIKVSCFLGITDNAINEKAIMPDSIVKSRKGKTVEILNTDAEGRLVLGDVLDYASSHKPDVIIDVATLTGACLIALGQEVCGLMGNDDKLKKRLKEAAKKTNEYIWELPIINEWRKDMESPIADLQNIGGTPYAGTAKAAAFLENFVGDKIAWAHLDIAGVSRRQSHLHYCPKKGASGLLVRTLFHYLHSF